MNIPEAPIKPVKHTPETVLAVLREQNLWVRAGQIYSEEPLPVAPPVPKYDRQGAERPSC